MEMAIAFGAWLAFAVVAGILARNIAVKVAKSKGWTAVSMPLSYYFWFLGIYLAVIQTTWIIIYFVFVK